MAVPNRVPTGLRIRGLTRLCKGRCEVALYLTLASQTEEDSTSGYPCNVSPGFVVM